MEAAAPPPAAPPPAPAATSGPRWPAILVAIVFVLVAIFFIAVSVSLAGDTLCEDAIQEAQETGQLTIECTEKSSGNRIATVVFGALAGLAALWTVFASIGVLRGTRTWSSVGTAAALAVVFAVVTIVL
jgi:hypothetical protein